MAREKSKLEQLVADRAAQNRQLRESAPEDYVKQLQESRHGGAMGPASAEDAEALGNLLVEAKKIRTSVATASSSERMKEEMRLKDERARFDTERQAGKKQLESLEALRKVFKEQTESMLLASKLMHRDQMHALRMLRRNGVGGGDGGSLFDLFKKTPKGAAGGVIRGAGEVANASRAARAWSAVKNAGAKVVGPAVESAQGLARGLPGTIRGVGSTVLRTGGALVAPAVGAYEAYEAVTDDTKTVAQKSIGVSKAAGGVAGGVAGAEIGAMVGTAVAPGPGTLIGGAIGGVAGYLGGGALAETVGKAVTDAVSDTAVGTALGRTAAIAMTPFSEDARDALKQDWKKISSDLSETLRPLETLSTNLISKLGDYTDALASARNQIWGGIKSAAKTVVASAKTAATQVKDGFSSGGIGGAIKAIPKAARTVAASAADATSEVGSSLSTAGATMRYAAEKGSSNPLELALGFSGKRTLTGLSEAQTRAYAGNVMKTESGGKLGIVNQYGFAGQYQFGAEALADHGLVDKTKLEAARKASGKNWWKGGGHKAFMEDSSNWKNPGGREAFMTDKQLQDDTFVKYTNSNIAGGFRRGKDGRSALTASSTPEDIAAYAKAAHLKGTGGANALFKDGVDSQDANGTKTSKYARDGAQAMSALATKVESELKTPTGVKAAAAKSPDAPVTAKTVLAPVASASTAIPAPPAKVAPLGVSVTKSSSTVAAPTAEAKALPPALVNPSTPTETSRVVVLNPTPPAPAPAAPAPASVPMPSSIPSLDEIPMHVNDFGLVLMNTMHV